MQLLTDLLKNHPSAPKLFCSRGEAGVLAVVINWRHEKEMALKQSWQRSPLMDLALKYTKVGLERLFCFNADPKAFNVSF